MYNICYWSVADNEFGHDKMMVTLIDSARKVGIKENFHVFSNVPIKGAITHDSGSFDKKHYLFKFDFLLEMKKLMYDYFVFVDADSMFLKNIEADDLIKYCHNSPVHITFEGDCTNPEALREDWWGCPLAEYSQLMWDKGVKSKKIYNTNAGFWIVHRDAIDSLCRLAREFWDHANSKGYPFTEEAPLAYAGHMLCGDANNHLLTKNPELWASDWLGHFADRLPVIEEWGFHDYMTHEIIKVNPILVHAMRSKQKMIEYGKLLSPT